MFAPTDVFDDQFVFDDDERPVAVRWSPSETDDCVSLWLPVQRILWAGPAVIHGFPNIGTPQRICRDTRRWIDTLDAMLELDAEILIPEFGEITRGADEVRDRLQTTRDALQWLVDETMTRINRGMTDVEIIHDVTLPPEFTDPPYLRSNYGAPEYVIRDLFREQSGWWTSRNPTDLHPLHPDDAAAAIRSVVDADVVLATARSLIAGDQHQAAMHVLDLIAMAPATPPKSPRRANSRRSVATTSHRVPRSTCPRACIAVRRPCSAGAFDDGVKQLTPAEPSIRQVCRGVVMPGEHREAQDPAR